MTNSLTGWEPTTGAKQHIIAFPQLEAERDFAEKVKRNQPILVILGNPPYNAFAGVSPTEELGLVEPYKEGPVKKWKIKKFNLDDLYIRFFRIAERRIAERTGRGVVAFISNHSWISEPSFVVMRKHLLRSFDRFWIENLHGNRKTSEYAPDGRTSETIFAIQGFSTGIQQGVATSLWVKSGKRTNGSAVLYRDDLNEARAADRRAQLLESLKAPDFDEQYEPAKPEKANRYSLRPSNVSSQYSTWPQIIDLCAMPPSNGLMEKRGGTLIAIDPTKLENRMRAYLDPKLDWVEYQALGYGLTEEQGRFDPKAARLKIQGAEKFDRDRRLVRYALRPFDSRWAYYTGIRPIWNEPRPRLWAQCWDGNEFLMTRPVGVASPEGVPFYFTRWLGDNDFLRGHAYYFPIRLKGQITRANLSSTIRAYLDELNVASVDESSSAGLVWMHALAVGYSLKYLTENADGVRMDWPRIPLPDSKDALIRSAELGRQVAALLDTEGPVPNVTSSAIRLELAAIAVISREGGGSLDPNKGHLALTAGWGHPGKGGAVMPGKGRSVGRKYSLEEIEAIEPVLQSLG